MYNLDIIKTVFSYKLMNLRKSFDKLRFHFYSKKQRLFQEKCWGTFYILKHMCDVRNIIIWNQKIHENSTNFIRS